MGLFDRQMKQRVKTEEIHDGYCLVSFKKSFLRSLKDDFEKQANKDYKAMKDSLKRNNGIPVIPANYNANNVKYRMQIESAIDDGGVVGIQINNTDNYSFDYKDYAVLQNKLFNSDVEFLPFMNEDETLFICPNDKNNLEKISDIVYAEIINKRETCGVDISKKDGFLNKDLNFEEQKFVEKITLEMLAQGMYLGDQQLALNLISADEHLAKVILQEKHRKDVEKILIFLAIDHITYNDAIIISKKDLKYVNENIDNYIHGAIIVKDKQIYGVEAREQIQKNSVEPEKTKADIDQLIERLKVKNTQEREYRNTNELVK